MAKTTTLPLTQNLNVKGVTILPADTTALKTIYTGGSNDAILKALNITSTDTSVRNVALWLSDGTTDFLLGTMPIAATSGFDGVTPAVDGLSGLLTPSLPFDNNGKRVIPMKVGSVLKIGSLTTVTTAKQITALALIEEF
jgi:hypothetical protein